jgi:DNA-binding transcriptional LysR family regulator
MELRQLRSFLLLAEELHFKKAADKLFIVQPALTKQIQELEKELGVALFERNKRSVKLTLAGQFFKEKMGKILAEMEQVKNQISLVEKGINGAVRIGYVGSCIHTFLPDLLTKLQENYPNIQTYLSELPSTTQLLAVQKGELDIAFLRNPPPNKRLNQELVFRESFSLVLPADHVLEATNFETMQQVAHEKFVMPKKNDGDLYQQLQWSICEDAGFKPQIAHETVHGQTTLKLVENGMGISILPTSFQTVTNARVKFIELKNIPQMSEITAVWHTQNLNPSLTHFLRLLHEKS